MTFINRLSFQRSIREDGEEGEDGELEGEKEEHGEEGEEKDDGEEEEDVAENGMAIGEEGFQSEFIFQEMKKL